MSHRNYQVSTNFVRLDPTLAIIVERRRSADQDQVRVKHPDMPGVRWMNPAKNGGHYSRYAHGGAATCYFLPEHGDNKPVGYDPN